MSHAVSMGEAASSSMLGRPLAGGVVNTLRGVFPGTEVVTGGWLDDDGDRAGRKEMSRLHTALLWDGMTGYACLFTGVGGHYKGPRYAFASTSQRFFEWPAQRKELLTASAAAAPMSDVYLAPMLRASRGRKKGSGAPSRYLWADVDGQWTEERSEALVPLMAEGSFVVSSGSGRHVYVRLDEALPPAAVEQLNRRLAVLLDGDAKWDDTALLRLAGTWNHKSRALGGGSHLVGWCLP